MAKKHINEHFVVRDYGLCAMVKAAQACGLEVRADLLSKLVAYHQQQKDVVQCHKMCLPDLQYL